MTSRRDPAGGGGGAPEPERVAIVGAGSIGVAWTVVFSRAGFDVALHEPDGERRRLAPAELRARLDALAAAGLLDEDPASVAQRVRPADELATALAGAGYVQECAPEDLELKRALFARLDELAGPEAVLASSSSALPASQLAASLPGAARCLVAHPGNPPYLIPVVEIVPASFTSPGALERAESVLRRAGMSPVLLRREIEGFVFNRLQGAVLREAYCLVRDGIVAPEDVDRVMREGLGRRWSLLGPFETAELNTRGGIEAHARKLGPAYWRMGAARGQDDPWDDDLVATVSRAVQRRFPRAEWDRNVAWRDAALIALEAFRRSHPLLTGPDRSEDAADPSSPPDT